MIHLYHQITLSNRQSWHSVWGNMDLVQVKQGGIMADMSGGLDTGRVREEFNQVKHPEGQRVRRTDVHSLPQFIQRVSDLSQGRELSEVNISHLVKKLTKDELQVIIWSSKESPGDCQGLIDLGDNVYEHIKADAISRYEMEFAHGAPSSTVDERHSPVTRGHSHSDARRTSRREAAPQPSRRKTWNTPNLKFMELTQKESLTVADILEFLNTIHSTSGLRLEGEPEDIGIGQMDEDDEVSIISARAKAEISPQLVTLFDKLDESTLIQIIDELPPMNIGKPLKHLVLDVMERFLLAREEGTSDQEVRRRQVQPERQTPQRSSSGRLMWDKSGRPPLFSPMESPQQLADVTSTDSAPDSAYGSPGQVGGTPEAGLHVLQGEAAYETTSGLRNGGATYRVDTEENPLDLLSSDELQALYVQRLEQMEREGSDDEEGMETDAEDGEQHRVEQQVLEEIQEGHETFMDKMEGQLAEVQAQKESRRKRWSKPEAPSFPVRPAIQETSRDRASNAPTGRKEADPLAEFFGGVKTVTPGDNRPVEPSLGPGKRPLERMRQLLDIICSGYRFSETQYRDLSDSQPKKSRALSKLTSTQRDRLALALVNKGRLGPSDIHGGFYDEGGDLKFKFKDARGPLKFTDGYTFTKDTNFIFNALRARVKEVAYDMGMIRSQY